MPAVRLNIEAYAYNPVERRIGKASKLKGGASEVAEDFMVTSRLQAMDKRDVHYPQTATERASFKLKNGKCVTPHQWDVYDHILSIPVGKVTTYKNVSSAIGGSPRSVGNALRNNPFSPYVPCHRVIASDLFIGGFFGEWGKTHKTGTRYNQKLGILTREGVEFTQNGKLAYPDRAMWKPQSSEGDGAFSGPPVMRAKASRDVSIPLSSTPNSNIAPAEDVTAMVTASPDHLSDSVEHVPSGLIPTTSQFGPDEQAARNLGSLRRARLANSSPPSPSRNSRPARSPNFGTVNVKNSFRRSLDGSVSLTSLAISSLEVPNFTGRQYSSREPSGNQSTEGPSLPNQTGDIALSQKDIFQQGVSFDKQTSVILPNQRGSSRIARKSDPPIPSPVLRSPAYADYQKDVGSPKKPAIGSRSPSQPRSRATSPLRIIQQWSSNLYRPRPPADEPFVPVNPFTNRPNVSKCRICKSQRQPGSPVSERSYASSDQQYDCHHVVPFSTISKAVSSMRLLLIDTLPRQLYLNILLRLPAMYFSRVAKIFEDAEVSKPDIQRMIDAGGGGGFFLLPSAAESAHFNGSLGHGATPHPMSPNVASGIGLSSHIGIAPASVVNVPLPFPEEWTAPLVPPALIRFKQSWEVFIDSLMREWKTLNVVSALLLSAILTMFQIPTAASDPVTRSAALMSLICALMSLSYGCMYIVRFGTMRSMYRASRWAEEAQKSKTSILWNVWVFLAMPAVWMAWSMVMFIASILSFVWRTGSVEDMAERPPLSVEASLGPRLVITTVFMIGLVYFFLIVKTLQRYGSHIGVRGIINARTGIDASGSHDAAKGGNKHELEQDNRTERRGRQRERHSPGTDREAGRDGKKGDVKVVVAEAKETEQEGDSSKFKAIVGLGLVELGRDETVDLEKGL
ncbi:hypothetical protein AX17_002438 [Amanita inopinata Kibby_2008]|nr:hypothetical protein AX17_002438 [Amanita inopinata Kibby_2008]